MSVNVCPADTVHAPMERIWDLLMDPAGYGRFWDFTVGNIEPPGPAAVGQKFVGKSRALGKTWRIEFEIQELDPVRHHLQFRTALPLGIIGINRIMCSKIDEQKCMVRYG